MMELKPSEKNIYIYIGKSSEELKPLLHALIQSFAKIQVANNVLLSIFNIPECIYSE